VHVGVAVDLRIHVEGGPRLREQVIDGAAGWVSDQDAGEALQTVQDDVGKLVEPAPVDVDREREVEATADRAVGDQLVVGGRPVAVPVEEEVREGERLIEARSQRRERGDRGDRAAPPPATAADRVSFRCSFL